MQNTIVYIVILMPIILFIMGMFYLYLHNKITFLIFFIIGFIFNNLLNIGLKWLFQIERYGNTHDVHFENTIMHKTLGKELSNISSRFGLPSGHAQNCFYIITYLLLLQLLFKNKRQNSNTIVSIFFIVGTISSCVQRYVYGRHTIFQLIIGAIVGILFAIFIYLCCKKFMMTDLSGLTDDQCNYHFNTLI